jgi:dihydrolipoamide dehydrogenase
MVVGELAEGIDLLVVGGGPGGYSAALHAARLGRQVVLVDRAGRDGLGGTCLWVGCIPSKALIELAETRHRARSFTAAGLDACALEVDLARFQTWKAEIVSGLAEGVETLLGQRGVRVLAGTVTFNKPDRAAVATPDGNVTFFEFRDAVVAAGSLPIGLAALPRDGKRVLDSSDALALTEVPARLVVVGAGYIGVELGTAFAKLGSQVTIIESRAGVLPAMDAAVGRLVLRSLRGLGVEVLVRTEALRLEDGGLVVRNEGDERIIPTDRVVVAVGRRPNTNDLGLQTTGARLTAGGTVEVDGARLATRHIAAIGDITAGPELAHKATAEAEVAVDVLSGRRALFNPRAVPEVVFSDPEVAVVGLTEEQARSADMDVTVAQFPLSASGRAATMGSPAGFARLVIDRVQDAVVGVVLVGPHVSELAGEAALAVEMGASPEDLAGTIHPHPSISESLREAAGMAVGRPLHTAIS